MRRPQTKLGCFSAAVAIVFGLGVQAAPAMRPHLTGGQVAAATSGVNFQAVADSYVSSSKPRTNYGSASRLKEEQSPLLRGYLRFNPNGLTGSVTRATLWLYAPNRSTVGYNVRGVADNTWQESTISYVNAPMPSTSTVGSSGAYGAGQWTSVDVTSLVTGNGLVSFALTTSSMTSVSIASRESGASTAPLLAIETAATPDTTPPTTPTNLAVSSSTAASISLSWTASTDNVGVAGYDVLSGGTFGGRTLATSYTLSGLSCGSSYSIGVEAFDAAGNYSAPAPVTASTSPCPDTTAPSAPGTLTVTGSTSTSVALMWGPSFDNVAVSGYDVYLSGTKIGSTAATNYTVTGLSCGTTYTFGVAAYDAAGNLSTTSTVVGSSSACSDVQAPTAPTNLRSTTVGASSIAMSWTASTDNVGVAGYDVYLNGGKVASITTTLYTFSGLSCGTSYTIGVDAYDAAGNSSAKASWTGATTACATATAPQIPYRFAYSNRTDQSSMLSYGYSLIDVSTVNEADAVPAGTKAQVWLYDYDNTTCAWEKDDTYITNIVSQLANDPKVAGFYFSNEPDPVACPTAPQQHKDRNKLIHSLAPTKYTVIGLDTNNQQLYNTYGSEWVGAADILNYNPYICWEWMTTCDFPWLDHVLSAAQAQYNATGQKYSIALQAFAEAGNWRWPTGSEETQMLDRLKDPSLTGLIEYMTFSWDWQNDPLINHPDVLQAITAFNLSVSGTGDTTAPTAPSGLAASSATQTSVSLSWIASSDTVGVTGYELYRNGTLLGTTTQTSYTFSGLTCGTSYTLAVDALDAAGNRSPQAALTAATSPCSDTVAPTAPSALSVTATTTTSIAVSWGASFDNVGVAGYDLFRNGTKVATTVLTNYNFASLACGTSYTLGVEAFDAAGNRSTRSSIVTATSACATPTDTQAPTAPTNLTKTAATDTSISMSWSASTDNVGVTGYNVYSNGTKVANTALTSYAFSGLSCGTSYTLGVEATDAAANVSARSTLTAATNACAPAPTDPVIAAAGDICSTTTDCAPTAKLLDAIAPTRVLTLGDNAYPDGTSSDYSTYYDPNWGRFKSITSPAPGNHDYHTSGGAGYFAYFGSQAPAPYYSYDIGSWHLISLNGELDHSAGSAQETWLKSDLAAHPTKCTLAYWHEPRFSSGAEHGSDSSFGPFWQDLYAANADIVLNGHDHEYERFAPQNPSGVADANGIREWVVGTGGASHYSFATPIANSEVRDNTSFGVLKLTLHSSSYDWQFVPIAGATFTDSGSTACH